MKLTQLFKEKTETLSFEVFPPKDGKNYDSVKSATEEIAKLNPHYMSVTYGAGGGTGEYTVEISRNLQENFGVISLAHLTCVNSKREVVWERLRQLREAGIENILALRGDLLPDAADPSEWDYHYASELVSEIREFGGFCIGGACYPEGHVESEHSKDDIRHLKEKVDAGCQFLTTQMFFDNNILYNFLYRIREAGITVPVVAGIMPVTSANQIKRICQLSGTYLPQRFKAIVDRFGSEPAAMKQAGIAYATEQIIDLLANGVNHIHIYSMNKPEVAEQVQKNLSEIIR